MLIGRKGLAKVMFGMRNVAAVQLNYCVVRTVTVPTRGEIMIMQGAEELRLLSHDRSKIAEAHRGIARVRLPTSKAIIGTVIEVYYYSNTHQTASLCSCLTEG